MKQPAAVLLLLLGVSLLLYPVFSQTTAVYRQDQAIAAYITAVEQLSAGEKAARFRKGQQDPAALALTNGVIGYLAIPKLRLSLPIYAGASEEILTQGVGHLSFSSPPLGGSGTHCVLSAHRGLPEARMFTDLDRLEAGDCFFITVLDRLLCYEVDQILTVTPEQTDALAASASEDLCTLVTCTPYGINSHRLLVRGRRTETG